MPKREPQDATIIQFEGGHTTLVHLPVHEVAREIEVARETARELDHTLIFLQVPNLPDNSLCIDPFKVVALVRSKSHR